MAPQGGVALDGAGILARQRGQRLAAQHVDGGASGVERSALRRRCRRAVGEDHSGERCEQQYVVHVAPLNCGGRDHTKERTSRDDESGGDPLSDSRAQDEPAHRGRKPHKAGVDRGGHGASYTFTLCLKDQKDHACATITAGRMMIPAQLIIRRVYGFDAAE